MEEIINKIEQAGGKLYLVGGAVRDELLGKKAKDEDYCVVGISEDKFRELFPEARERGKAFAVFDLAGREFAMARTESKIGIGHKAFNIQTDTSITIEQDLERRDITINAIAKDISNGEIIDPYNGTNDLKNKVIRATSGKFKEDPLRVYRVARFAAQLEFNVESNTIKCMTELKNELISLSKERVFCEFRKAMQTNKPSIFFNVLKQAQILDVHFKEIADLIGVEQPVIYHPEGDAYNHTMQSLDIASSLTRDEKIRYATLVHDLGKGITPKEEYPHHYGHDKAGAQLVRNLSNRIGTPKNWKKAGITSAEEHMRGGIFDRMREAKKVDFLERINKSILGLDGLQIVVIADKFGNKAEIETINFEKIGRQMLEEIDGEKIKKKYGIAEGLDLKEKLREERIKWIKNVKEENICIKLPITNQK